MVKIGFLSHLDLNLYLFMLPIMKELVKMGWCVYAISPGGQYLERFNDFGIIPVEYSLDRGSLNLLKELIAIDNIYRAIKPLNLDILHTFTVKPNIYGTFAAKRVGVKNILNAVTGLGSFYIDNNIKSRIVRKGIEFLYKQAFKYSRYVVFVNNDDAEYMVKRKIVDPSKSLVIRSSGVDTEEFDMQRVDALRYREEVYEGKPIVMMVARAIWHKGVREFYEVAKLLHTKATFVYVGGAYPDNPSAVPMKFLESPYVKYLGHRDDIREIISICDIFVLPSYREGVPRTLLEAASMGKPIITTDTVGCREVVEDGKNGFLVPVKNVDELVKKILVLIDNPELREKFGIYSRQKVVREFDIKIVVSKHVRLYEKVLEENDC